jgi:hypothetical protein
MRTAPVGMMARHFGGDAEVFKLSMKVAALAHGYPSSVLGAAWEYVLARPRQIREPPSTAGWGKPRSLHVPRASNRERRRLGQTGSRGPVSPRLNANSLTTGSGFRLRRVRTRSRQPVARRPVLRIVVAVEVVVPRGPQPQALPAAFLREGPEPIGACLRNHDTSC